jgi:hypothetical protein
LEEEKKMEASRDGMKDASTTEIKGDINQIQTVEDRTTNTQKGTTTIFSIGQSLENNMSILQNKSNIRSTRYDAFERGQDEQITQLYQQLQQQGK